MNIYRINTLLANGRIWVIEYEIYPLINIISGSHEYPLLLRFTDSQGDPKIRIENGTLSRLH
jgi:hypothetical protein